MYSTAAKRSASKSTEKFQLANCNNCCWWMVCNACDATAAVATAARAQRKLNVIRITKKNKSAFRRNGIGALLIHCYFSEHAMRFKIWLYSIRLLCVQHWYFIVCVCALCIQCEKKDNKIQWIRDRKMSPSLFDTAYTVHMIEWFIDFTEKKIIYTLVGVWSVFNRCWWSPLLLV